MHSRVPQTEYSRKRFKNMGKKLNHHHSQPHKYLKKQVPTKIKIIKFFFSFISFPSSIFLPAWRLELQAFEKMYSSTLTEVHVNVFTFSAEA